MTDEPQIQRVAPRVQGHVDALREAGLNTEAFFDALVGIRDDTLLTDAHREALHRLLATESFVWYLEALRGSPVDRIALMEQAQQIAEKNAVAIKKQVEGQDAAELLLHTMQDAPAKAPPDAKTRLDRPPARTPPADAKTRLDRPPKKKG